MAIAVVVLAALTAWPTADEVLDAKLPSPAYAAVMDFVPVLVDVSEHWPTEIDAEQVADPSLTVTLPVGVPAPGPVTETV